MKQFRGYSCASRGGSSWGAGRERRRVCEENFGKYVDNSFNIAAGERCRSGNAGMTASFCIKKTEKKINGSQLVVEKKSVHEMQKKFR